MVPVGPPVTLAGRVVESAQASTQALYQPAVIKPFTVA